MEQLLLNGQAKKMSQSTRSVAHLFAIVKPQKSVDQIFNRLREECRYIQQQRQAAQSIQ